MMPTARLPRFLTFLFAALISLLALAGHAADEPLPAEEAFRASARLIDDKQVEIRFRVADGYYLYRHRFKFAADGISFGEPTLPPGKPKKDDAFGDVEIYRGELVFTLPISAGQPPFTLQLTSQGCADIGICYPPQVHALDVSSGSTVGSLLGRALGRSEAPAARRSAAGLQRGLSNWDHQLQGEISNAQQTLDYLERSSSQLQALKSELAAKLGTTAYMVDSADELRPEWFKGIARVGLTAGASAPEILVKQVIDRIKALGAVSVRKMQGIEETIKFPLPKGLKIDPSTGLEITERLPETGPAGH